MNERFLREAIRLSGEGVVARHGGPFGAVVVHDGEIVGRGSSRAASSNDPNSHAEIVAICDACARLGTFTLAGCEIYVSSEPCPMCLAAIYWARIERLYFAATREDAPAAECDDVHFYRELALPPSARLVGTTPALHAEALVALPDWGEIPSQQSY